MENNKVFDPLAWAQQNYAKTVNDNVEPSTAKAPLVTNSAQPLDPHPGDELAKAEAVADRLTAMGVSIANTYDEFLRLGFALADGLGEQGHDLFHRLCSLWPRYSQTDCEKKWHECLGKHDGRTTIATYYKMAKDAGVDLAEVSRQISAISAISAFPHAPAKNVQSSSNGIGNATYYSDNKVVNYTKETSSSTSETFLHKAAEIAEIAEIAENSTSEAVSSAVPARHFSVTFSDRLDLQDVPLLLREVAETQAEPEDRDKMMLAALDLWSGNMPGVRGIYGDNYVYPPIYAIINAPSGAKKGVIPQCLRLIDPIRWEVHRQAEALQQEYEEQLSAYEALTPKERKGKPKPKEPAQATVIIPANSSSTVFCQQLADNGGCGTMFETEADTLTQILKQDYGGYSDCLRKAFHHEAIDYSRRRDNERVYVECPRLSVLLTCTPGQIGTLLGGSEVENGSANRYLFYSLKGSREWQDPFAHREKPLADSLLATGQRYLELYHELLNYKGKPLEFTFSEEQKALFNSYYRDLLPEQVGLVGDDFIAFIFRLGLTTFRLAMMLSVLRRYEQKPHFDALSNVIVCTDQDFRTALTIADCLVSHTAYVYTNLLPHDQKALNPQLQQMTQQERHFYDILSQQFDRKLYVELAAQAGINVRTAERYVGLMVNRYQVVKRVSHGHYVKVL